MRKQVESHPRLQIRSDWGITSWQRLNVGAVFETALMGEQPLALQSANAILLSTN